MSGRRLRHVNAEKRKEEWKLEEEERMLEKKAETYLKKIAKGEKGGKRDDGAEKYVEKYRADSAKCVEEVEESVRELKEVLFRNGKKRKATKNGADIDGSRVKNLKIWMGKRKLGKSESDDSSGNDEKSDESDVENEKPSFIDNGSHSDTSKDGSFRSASVIESDVDYQSGGPSGNGSEEEKETVTVGCSGSDGTPSESNAPINGNSVMDTSSDASDFEGKATQTKELSNRAIFEQASGQPDSLVTEFADHLLSTASFIDQEVSQLAKAASEGHRMSDSESKPAPHYEGVNGSSNV